jgi:glycosyl hydrolase family 42 (putative beta-galactosidase)
MWHGKDTRLAKKCSPHQQNHIKLKTKSKERKMNTKSKLPWWKEEGLIKAGGWHPLNARLRNNANNPENEEELYEWEHSEERVLRLKELGINLVIGQFDRGLGDSDEAEEHEKAKKLVELCHKHGIKHGAYMANTIYFESVMKDYPDCEDWVVHTHDNRFVHYGGEQTFRWVGCFNSPGWRDRTKRHIKKAIEYVKTDLLHFDNLAVWPEPDSCHCKYCQEKFRKFLYEKYPTEKEQKSRFGFPGFENFRAPNFYIRFLNPWDFDRIRNPLMQDWIEFRCQTVTDYIREMSKYAKSLNPGIAIDSNGQSVWGANQAFLHGINQTQQAAHVDIVCEENPDWKEDSEPDAIPKVTHKMRGMNLMRQLGKLVFTSYKNEEELAFNMAFCGCPGISPHWGYAEPRKGELKEAQAGVIPLLNHLKNNKDLYLGATPMAKIAVWRNQRSLAWSSFDTHLSACVMEHILYKRRIPFCIIQDESFKGKNLAKYDLLILPNVEYICDEQIDAINKFVEEGGSVLITENSGVYKENGRARRKSAFSDMFGESFSASARGLEETANFDPNKQFASKQESGASATSICGQGKCAYLGKIAYKHKPRTFKTGHNVHYDTIDSRYWKDPYNVDEILDLIEWLKPDYKPVKIFGQPEARMDWIKFRNGDEGCQILRCGELDSTADLRFAVLSEKDPKNALLYLPENDEPVPLEWTKTGKKFETCLRHVARLAVVKYGALS